MSIVSWFKSLFDHPKTTVAGIGSLVGAAALGYGMATGVVPINAQTVATMGGLASAGVAGIAAKDATGQKVVDATNTITAAAPTAVPSALALVDQYKSMQAEAQDAQAKLDTFATVTQAIAQALPPAQQ